MQLKGLVDLTEPFGAIGGTTATTLVQRQVEPTQQAGDLFPGGDMAEIGASSKGDFVNVIQRGQSTREKLPVNHPLGKTIDRAEAEPERQFIETLGNQLLVA